MELRLAGSTDLDTVLAFMREYYAFDRLPFDPVRVRAALARILEDASLGYVWIIRDGAEAVGYIVLTLGYSLEHLGRDAFIDEFYLRVHGRGRGMGRQALAFVEDACRHLGVNALHLEVERKNEAAQALYRKAGFEDHDRYLMTKRIPAAGERPSDEA